MLMIAANDREAWIFVRKVWISSSIRNCCKWMWLIGIRQSTSLHRNAFVHNLDKSFSQYKWYSTCTVYNLTIQKSCSQYKYNTHRMIVWLGKNLWICFLRTWNNRNIFRIHLKNLVSHGLLRKQVCNFHGCAHHGKSGQWFQHSHYNMNTSNCLSSSQQL